MILSFKYTFLVIHCATVCKCSPFLKDSSDGHHNNSWSRVYEGTDLEYLCSNLRPGRLVRVRGLSQSAGGWSEASPILTVQLPPVVPSACPAPQLQGKPKANSLILVWGSPEDDGGAAVS